MKYMRINGPPTTHSTITQGQYDSSWNIKQYNQEIAITRNKYDFFWICDQKP